MSHLRANLFLAILTLVLCSVLYPALLWVIGQGLFSDQAEGSIVTGPNKKPVGSRLIAQPFSGPEFFQPRPSAVGYNAAASGGSNLGSSNYVLRDRVARMLGPIVKYRAGGPVAPDIEKWFKKTPGLITAWATEHPAGARAWAGADPAHTKLIEDWKKANPAAVKEWQAHNKGEPTSQDLAVPFFKSFAALHPGTWPKGSGDPTWSVAGVFFEPWLKAHPKARLEPVPADMVTTSGSGLDPHITLKNAHYQLDRVVSAWAKKLDLDKAKVRKEIETLLAEKTEAPLGGWFGVPLVNVLEINLALEKRLERLGNN